MIFDNENMFFDAVDGAEFASGKESAVIENLGGGDAVDPLFLAVIIAGGEGQLKADITTAKDKDFTEPVELGTFQSAQNAKGLAIKAKVPFGLGRYLKVKLTGTVTGKVTVGLTQNVPNELPQKFPND